MHIEHLYRYPVKGLTPEALEEAELSEGEALPWDRAFALARPGTPFDPERPEWLQKRHFLCLARDAGPAALRSHFDPKTGILTIRAPGGDGVAENALTEAGRAVIGAFLARFLEGEADTAGARFHYVPGHCFSDHKNKVVSLINLASLAALEAKAGARRHLRRFRANIWFNGAPAWAELDWVGREIQLGSARLRVTKRIPRCAATEVNPETAQRDANPVAELRAHFGHPDLGVYAQVLEGGRIAVGDGLEVLPE